MSANHPPRIAIGPGNGPDWVRDAIDVGGGRLSALQDAQALVWASYDDVAGLAHALATTPDIRWVHLPWSGIDAYVSAGLVQPDRRWTCGKGLMADYVAEHALALVLSCLREIPQYVRAAHWGTEAGSTLHGAHVAVVGAGATARELIRLLTPFRTKITVVRRRTEAMSGTRVVTPDALHATLRESKIVFLALALTPETTGLIGMPELRAIGSGGYLVNVARGRHVVTADLVRALAQGQIAGAALDVTDPEPLPPEHPLWRLPNCIVTPHTANLPALAPARLQARLTENIARFATSVAGCGGQGEELLGLIDPSSGY